MSTLLLTATATAESADLGRWVALAVLAWLGWRLVLIVAFPYGPHRACKGTGKHKSGKYWRPCRRCKGTGRRIRLGRRMWDWTRNKEVA